MSLHLNLGNEMLRPDIRAQVLTLAALDPGASISINITSAELMLLLGAPTVVKGTLRVEGDISTAGNVEGFSKPTPAAVSTKTETAAPVEASGKIRRTKAELDAGLTVEEASFFRQSGGGDPVAYKASLSGDKGDTGVVTSLPVASPPPPPPAPPPAPDAPVVITEADVRAAAVAGVKGGQKDAVIAIAKAEGVSDWKALDPSRYNDVLGQLTALMVIA